MGGKLNIWQPKRGYRAGADPVFLAAAVAAVSGQSVLELGCGAGVAILCLGRRVAGVNMTGVEVQPDYAELARLNAVENGIEVDVVTADLCDLPKSIRGQSFDHVFANPPYFKGTARIVATDCGRERSLAGVTPLEMWIDIAIRRLKPQGIFTVIQKADRLADILAAVGRRLGGVTVKPLVARQGQKAELILVTAQKGARAPLRLLSPMVLHKGAGHERDGDSYSDAAQAILRRGAVLEID